MIKSRNVSLSVLYYFKLWIIILKIQFLILTGHMLILKSTISIVATKMVLADFESFYYLTKFYWAVLF